ncbi:MAG: Uma2 family endonuclease [Acidimicrobiales bacterium]
MATVDTAVGVRRHLFTVEEWHRMGEAGLFGEDDRVELLDGEVVDMSPIGLRHAACVKRLNQHLMRLVEGRAIVSVQDPLRLDDRSEPLPDVALLRPRADFYVSAHPVPGDTLVAIEVADTSLVYDRDRKAPHYAASGVPETWVVDLTGRQVLVMTDPGPDGYGTLRRVGRGSRLAPTQLPGLTLPVDDILP